jgi:hypothetical protein
MLQAECLQLWGDAEVALLQEAPDEALSQQLQQQGQQRAAGLYQSSVQAYQQVGCRLVAAAAQQQQQQPGLLQQQEAVILECGKPAVVHN